jgi:hypothetical protein
MVRMAGEARFTGFALAWIFKAVRDHSTPNGFETAWFHRPKRAARDDVHGRNGRQYRGGLVKIGEWRRLLTRARRKGYFLGVRETRYPRDFATFVRFETALRKLGLPFELSPPLPLARFEALVREEGPRLGVRLMELADGDRLHRAG